MKPFKPTISRRFKLSLENSDFANEIQVQKGHDSFTKTINYLLDKIRKKWFIDKYDKPNI